MLSVPLDYSKPNGTHIKLAISRVKHSVPASKFQGIMLVNPGGPGGSGLSLSTLGSDVPDNVGDDYDWIGFDPRGVGSSVPAISCDNGYFNFDRPNYDPQTPADLRDWLDRSSGYAAHCAREQRPNPRSHDHDRLGPRHGQHPKSARGREADQLLRVLLRHVSRPGVRHAVPALECGARCSTATWTRATSGTRPT